MSLEALDKAIDARGGADAVVARSWQHLAGPGRLDVAAPRQLEYVLAADLPDDLQRYDDEIVEGAIGRNAIAVVYGDSNTAKTFLSVDMGCSVERGVEWLGRRTIRGAVVYLATESPASVEMRLRAYQRHHGVRVPGFVIVRSPINLYESAADVKAVVELVRSVEAEVGEKVVLIIADTLARISAGANENSGEDMGKVMANADAIRRETGATFLWIHHSGKDQAKGMRGWSGIRAAIDTEIEVTADEATGVRTAEFTKQRDLPGKGDRIGFKLEPVHLGENQWGTPRGSCVVVSSEPAPKRQQGRRTSEVAGAITELLDTRGTGMKKGEIVQHLTARYDKSAVYRELKKLLEADRLHEVAGVYALRSAQKKEREE